MNTTLVRVAALVAAVSIPTLSVAAVNPEIKVKQIVQEQVKAWAYQPKVIAAIKAQNKAHAKLKQEDIDRLDKQWRSETKTGERPLIDKVLGNSLSAYLKKVKADAKGLYTEIFVMDNKGLNVGQSDVTSDYWQGDEAKWKKTYLVGPDALFIDKVKYDESSQQFQVQANLAITDPETKKVIGAVTVGIRMSGLE